MASRRMRTDLREGESSRTSQGNSGLVMAIFMAAPAEAGDSLGRRLCYAINPRPVRQVVEKSAKKNSPRRLAVILHDPWGNDVCRQPRQLRKDVATGLRNWL